MATTQLSKQDLAQAVADISYPEPRQMTPYQRIYLTLDKFEREALDLRYKWEQTLTSHDYRYGDDSCTECGEFGSVTSYRLCTECFIDDSLLHEDDIDHVVRRYYADELPTEEMMPRLRERYVAWTRELDAEVMKQAREDR